MIRVSDLSFSYTKNPFLNQLNFEVKKGEIFGFLGPSGAGKSTLQKILTGQIQNYQGSAVVNGIEIKKRTSSFYEEIGVDFEFPSLYEKLSAKENLEFFASLYQNRGKSIEALLDSVHLLKDQQKKVSQFSKGMKSRLNFIKALVNDPKLLFLDEPTSGLDPANSFDMKEIIKAERAKGKTIILTTHNMEDAAQLCDRVAFIVDGEIRALDTPHHLIMSKGAKKITYTYLDQEKESIGECLLEESAKDKVLTSMIAQNRLLSIHSSEPTLNDIFIEITGRSLI